MADPLLIYIRRTLPGELSEAFTERLEDLEQARFPELFSLPLVKKLLGHEDDDKTKDIVFHDDWREFLANRLDALLSLNSEDAPANSREHPAFRQHVFLLVAIAALHTFMQANITGPPLAFSPACLLFAKSVCPNPKEDPQIVRRNLVISLSIDGEAAYKLTPYVELLCLATVIMKSAAINEMVTSSAWVKLRVDFMNQRILSEVSPTLQESLYKGLDTIDDLLGCQTIDSEFDDLIAPFLLEKAAVHTHHGLDSKARDVLYQAAKKRHFTFALTGVLGKRTRYQERDISQLVVLAVSHADTTARASEDTNDKEKIAKDLKPQALALDDDTLLEQIAFTQKSTLLTDIVDLSSLPPSLSSIDPNMQPLLEPLDSIILLSLASSITNTRPADGLTREETLPYAQRVLSGGSSNWQIYTQALLIRSRIEGHRSRTTERGLLQLQALVDQVIADTTEQDSNAFHHEDTDRTPTIILNDQRTIETASTFLPRASKSDSAPAPDRLVHLHALSSPTRWELEAELAARWVSLGGLRSALDIYERLEMWAEAALCWAATEREDKARKIVKRLLFHPSSGSNDEDWVFDGSPREPPPSDAPRLYCILGDLDLDVNMYEKAWNVSGGRYARAQRSVGRHWFSRSVSGGDTRECLLKCAAAYSKSLKINQLHGPSWFAMGCALMELQEFERSAEAFARVVQLDEFDAESWSNLATSLLKKGNDMAGRESNNNTTAARVPLTDDADEGDAATAQKDAQQNIRSALRALRRAASIKHDSARIWDNLITVAFTLSPPSWSDVLTGLQRVIALRSPKEGELSVDTDILEALTREVVGINYFTTDGNGERVINADVQRGLPRLFIEVLEYQIVPLITTSARLWRVVSTVALWRAKPGEALEALEKGWRAATLVSGWEDGDHRKWDAVVEATIELVDGYESLGDQVRETSVGTSATEVEAVAKDWKFKGRSAIRGVIGKARATWEGTRSFELLKDRLEDLKQ